MPLRGSPADLAVRDRPHEERRLQSRELRDQPQQTRGSADEAMISAIPVTSGSSSRASASVMASVFNAKSVFGRSSFAGCIRNGRNMSTTPYIAASCRRPRRASFRRLSALILFGFRVYAPPESCACG